MGTTTIKALNAPQVINELETATALHFDNCQVSIRCIWIANDSSVRKFHPFLVFG
jgi:hypothetical protein